MKKFILTFAAVVFAALAVNAQPRAIGARFGYGIDLSYQHSVGQNMISAELEFPGYVDGIAVAATYDWINPGGAIIPWNYKGEWNWYAGVGAGLGFGWPNISKNTVAGVTTRNSSNCFNIGVAGRIGIEYQFWFPLQLSFDWRPIFGPAVSWYNKTEKGGDISRRQHGHETVFYKNGLYAGAICLGVRYRF